MSSITAAIIPPRHRDILITPLVIMSDLGFILTAVAQWFVNNKKSSKGWYLSIVKER